MTNNPTPALREGAEMEVTVDKMYRAIKNHICGNCDKRIKMSCNYQRCEDMASLRHATESELRAKYAELKGAAHE